MLDLIKQYFTIKRLSYQVNNRKFSLLAFYDKSSRISNKCRVQRFVTIRKSQIDSYTYIGRQTNMHNVTIGKFCSISSGISIGLGTHPISFISTSPIFLNKKNGTGFRWSENDVYDGSPKPTTIGNDVWIGINSTIVGGVKIGNGAIIASHSVITKDVPAYAIVGGVPAKILKYRFDETTRLHLEETKWWELPDEIIKSNIGIFQKQLNLQDIAQLNKLKIDAQ